VRLHHGRSENWAVNRAGAVSGLRQTPLTSFLDLAWRTAFRLAFPLARMWWRLTRPRHEGIVVAVYVGPALLLVRSSYRRGWHLPGGGVRRGEMPETAARRELAAGAGRALRLPSPFNGAILGDWRPSRVWFLTSLGGGKTPATTMPSPVHVSSSSSALASFRSAVSNPSVNQP
jgi:hypothetical protein